MSLPYEGNGIIQWRYARILRGYSINDIDLPTLQRYRRVYNIHHENHPWIEEDDMAFLEHIGAYRKDRSTSTEGFTVAGMLMFGKTDSITDPECCPEFFPDYRERLSLYPGERWSNRVYPDGTWEANLYQFFTRVLPMLQQALQVPYKYPASTLQVLIKLPITYRQTLQVPYKCPAGTLQLLGSFLNCSLR